MSNTNLSDATQYKYLQMANSFFSKQELSFDVPPHTLFETLKSISPEYRPAYWRNLRNAISYFYFSQSQHELAKKIRTLSNPVTHLGIAEIKPKQKRCKKVTEHEMELLITEAIKQKNRKLVAAIFIANLTGCRPSEMPTISQTGPGTFEIIGGKKRTDRGLDRLILIQDKSTAELFSKMVRILSNHKMKPIQNSFDRLARKVFRKREVVPSLYSFRHQMGSVLKASNISRKSIAYMMGHRVTKSVNVYGDRRTSGRRNIEISPGVSDSEIELLVRDNHQFSFDREETSAAKFS